MRGSRRTVLIVGLTAVLLWWFLRHANLGTVAREVQDAQPLALLLSLSMTVATYVIRAVRWQYLLSPIGHVRFRSAFRTTVIGFATNALLPGRLGEIVRPYLLARRERLSGTAAFATIFLERVLDVAAILLLFGVFVVLFDPGLAAVDAETFRAVRVGGIIAGAVSLVSLGATFVLAAHPERLGRATSRLAHLLPANVARAAGRLVEAFVRGFAVMREPGRLGVAVLLSVLLWVSIAAGVWFVMRAFHLTLPYTSSFLVLTFLAVGVLVPTPGGLGGFHEAFRFSVHTFYGVPNDRAVAAAVVLHALTFVPVIVAGLVFMAQEGLTLGRLREVESADNEGVAAKSVGASDGRHVSASVLGRPGSAPVAVLDPARGQLEQRRHGA
ncbi:MAG: flippase-like domain-containing protein [Luteitalea sp.]|nr:flippase-like domain-containing protein [Luteitalea sp.]